MLESAPKEVEKLETYPVSERDHDRHYGIINPNPCPSPVNTRRTSR